MPRHVYDIFFLHVLLIARCFMAYYYFDTFAQKVANTYNNVYVCVCIRLHVSCWSVQTLRFVPPRNWFLLRFFFASTTIFNALFLPQNTWFCSLSFFVWNCLWSTNISHQREKYFCLRHVLSCGVVFFSLFTSTFVPQLFKMKSTTWKLKNCRRIQRQNEEERKFLVLYFYTTK